MSDPSNLEHLDEVVSAYVDGEATPEEVRLVEGDPALIEQARLLTDLMAMDRVVPEPNAAMKQRHLSAAMAAFEAPAETSDPPIVDLTPAAASAPAEEQAENVAAPVIDLTSRRRGPAGLPRWLSAAAGTLVVLGGIGFVINQNGASEDSAATDSADSAEIVSNSRPEDEGESAGSAAQAMETDAMEDEAMEDDSEAMSDDAASDDAASDESIPTTTFAEVAGDEAMEEAEGDVDTEAADTSDADADTPSPAINVDGDATIDDLLLIIEGLEGMPLTAAICADSFTSSIPDVEDRVGPFNADGNAVEVFSLLVDGQINEFFVVNTIEGERNGVLFDSDCTMIDR